jgi:hypothetical protein
MSLLVLELTRLATRPPCSCAQTDTHTTLRILPPFLGRDSEALLAQPAHERSRDPLQSTTRRDEKRTVVIPSILIIISWRASPPVLPHHMSARLPLVRLPANTLIHRFGNPSNAAESAILRFPSVGLTIRQGSKDGVPQGWAIVGDGEGRRLAIEVRSRKCFLLLIYADFAE